MEKRSFNSRFVLVLLVMLWGTSCVELDVVLKWDSPTRGTIEVGAFFYRMAQGVPTEPGVRTFPTNRSGWEALAQSIPGLTVAGFESSDEALGNRYTVSLTFANPAALTSLFAAFKQKATLESTQSLSTLTLESTTPRLSKATKETKDLWNALWGERYWTFTVTAPSVVRSNNVGERIDPRTAVLRVKLSSFTEEAGPPVWKLTW